jgi:SAM-dependent methyltransferase
VQVALGAYLKRVAADEDHHAGAVAAARSVRRRPWDVVRYAGLLARCTLAVADEDFGLSATLRRVPLESRAAVARVAEGQPYPLLAHAGRRSRGAFDTPIDMARRLVKTTLRAVDGPTRTGLDLACGPGSFLLAMTEAGIPEVFGTDIDATALAVAQIACPKARLLQEDALKHGPQVDVVCGNPPYVPPERQDKALRVELRRRFPWLRGRFDLVVPFAAVAAERVRPRGAMGLVLPAAAMVQPYGAVLRRRWVERHAVEELMGPMPFPGAAVDVMLVVLRTAAGPAPLPPTECRPPTCCPSTTCPSIRS